MEVRLWVLISVRFQVPTSDVSLRVEPASSLRVRITHPRRRNSHVPFHHPLQSPVGEADEKEHARLPEHLCINWWLIRTRKKVGESNPQNDTLKGRMSDQVS